MSQNQPRDIICPRCYKPLAMASSNIVCPFCRIIITLKPIKDLEIIHYTSKELEELEQKKKIINKEKHIEEARKKNQEELIKKGESS